MAHCPVTIVTIDGAMVKGARVKRCSRCGEIKPTDQFYRCGSSRDGLQTYCMPCQSAYAKAYREAHPDRARAAREAYKPTRRVAERARYAKRRDDINAYARAWAKEHADRLVESHARYYAANRERVAQRMRRWREANPERVGEYWRNHHHRKRSGDAPSDVTVDTWLALVHLWEGCCAYCGSPADPLTQDHIRPLSRGGAHVMSNLLPACMSCNTSKNARFLWEWPRYRRIAQGVISA